MREEKLTTSVVISIEGGIVIKIAQFRQQTIITLHYIPGSNLLFWNKQYFPSKSIESWNLAQTQVNIENSAVNTLKFVICFHFQVMPL